MPSPFPPSSSFTSLSLSCTYMWLHSLLLPHIPSYCVTSAISLLFLLSKCLTFPSGIISLLSKELPLAILLEQVYCPHLNFLSLPSLETIFIYLNSWRTFSLDTEVWLDRWGSVSHGSSSAWVVSAKASKKLNVHIQPTLGLYLTRGLSSKRRLDSIQYGQDTTENHSSCQENHMNEKKWSTDSNTEENQILELSDKILKQPL